MQNFTLITTQTWFRGDEINERNQIEERIVNSYSCIENYHKILITEENVDIARERGIELNVGEMYSSHLESISFLNEDESVFETIDISLGDCNYRVLDENGIVIFQHNHNHN